MEIETNETGNASVNIEWSHVRSVVDSYYDLQRLRIAVEHRIRKLTERGIAADVHGTELTQLHRTLEHEESSLVVSLDTATKDHPMRLWLRGQRGIGPVLSAGLLAYFDPARAPHISSFWKFAGMSPDAKLEKGKKAPYSQGAKVLCWKVGHSFIMSSNPEYTLIYRQKKEELMKRDKMTKGHAHNYAARVMVKRFLADFWTQWRKMEGLPVDEPYAIAILNHTKQED